MRKYHPRPRNEWVLVKTVILAAICLAAGYVLSGILTWFEAP